MKKIFAIALLGLLSACGSAGRSTIVSRNLADNAGGMPTVRSALVLFNVVDTGFNGSVYQSFNSSVIRRLEQCGVHTASFEYNPMSLDTEENIRKKIEKNNSDIVFRITKNGGSIVTGSGGTHGTRYYKLDAIDPHTNKTLWQANVSFSALTKNMFRDDEATGNKFGSEIVARLAQDRVIANCPVEAITFNEN